MWIDVAFEATLQSPFTIKKKRNEQFPETLGYIPGSTLRGMFASAWIRRYGLGEDFYRLFTQGQQRYPFLYPGSWQSSPYPLTTVSCKRHGGPNKHGVEDLLCYYATGKEEELGKRFQCNHALPAKAGSNAKPSSCGEDRKPFAGYVYAYQKSQEMPPRVRYRSRMGVGLDATTGSTAGGILYGRSAVDDVWRNESAGTNEASQPKKRPAVFAGIGRVEERYLEDLQDLCKTPMFLGSERSRGFGQVRMTLQKQQRPALEARLAQFQKSQGDGAFAILLRTPTILLDRYLRNHLDLEKAVSEIVELKDPYQHVKSVHLATWNVVHRIHKDDEWGLSAGSVLYAKSPLPRKDLLSKLQELEAQGLGERREEGFGQIIVCAPLHLPLVA